MQNSRAIEFIAGLLVITIAFIFVVFTISVVSGIHKNSSYTIGANFNNVGGLMAGSSVVLNGVKVGIVNNVAINPETLKVDVNMSVDATILVPDDSTAVIDSADLLGGKIITIKPGHSQVVLKPNEHINKTIDFISLEQRIGDILFLVTK